jgi:membrane fusion protein (multidrug efflux system)
VVPLRSFCNWPSLKLASTQTLRIGQAASLQADFYGKKVEYHGKVAGLGAGTGSAFSLLPAQNATGNWIKIVQRVPVRIELRPDELAAHPLRVGLSMDVTVDVRDATGKTLADAPRAQAVASTAVFDDLLHNADERVHDIVAGNSTAHASAAAAAAPTDLRKVAGTPRAPAAVSAL